MAASKFFFLQPLKRFHSCRNLVGCALPHARSFTSFAPFLRVFRVRLSLESAPVWVAGDQMAPHKWLGFRQHSLIIVVVASSLRVNCVLSAAKDQHASFATGRHVCRRLVTRRSFSNCNCRVSSVEMHSEHLHHLELQLLQTVFVGLTVLFAA